MDNHAIRLIKRGKKLSYLLRHDKSYAFVEHGRREVNDLVINNGFTMEELREIVASNNKKRYEFSEDMTRIRARQGHSIQVDVELAEATPPDMLYHGTAKAFVESIVSQGILKGKRLYVHLSTTIDMATKVGGGGMASLSFWLSMPNGCTRMESSFSSVAMTFGSPSLWMPNI